MEIELKYSIADSDTADRISKDAGLQKLEEKDSRDAEELCGRYYDTVDLILQKNDVAFRMRREGKKLVATMKWNGETSGALHSREELNINLGDCDNLDPQPEVFAESEEGRRMLDLIGERTLHCIMEVNVLRRSFRVDTGKSLVEISIDQGEIITSKGTEPVCELELELFGGEEEDMLKLGDHLAQEYALEMGTISKFARGLKLLKVI